MSTPKIVAARKRLRDACINGGYERLPKWWKEVQAKLAKLRSEELYSPTFEAVVPVTSSRFKDVILQVGDWDSRYLLFPGDLINVEMTMAMQEVRIAELEWENQLLKEALEDAKFDPAANKEK